MLILNLSKDLLNYILKRHYSRCASKLVNHNCQALFTCHKLFHKLLCGKGFGYKRNGLDMLLPVILVAEHLGRMDVPYYVVHIAVINQYLGISGLNELLPQLSRRNTLFYGAYLIAGHHTVTGLYVRKVQDVLKNPDLRIRLAVPVTALQS